MQKLKRVSHHIRRILSKNKDPLYVEYIKRSNENCRKIQPLICCPLQEKSIKPPTEITETIQTIGATEITVILETTEAPKKPNSDIQGRLLMPSEGCGFSKAKNTKIVGGQTSKPGSSR